MPGQTLKMMQLSKICLGNMLIGFSLTIHSFLLSVKLFS